MKSQWTRVSKKNRCPICNHDSWCLMADKVVLCMRESSSTQKVLKTGETGYLHRLEGNHPIPPHKATTRPERKIDWDELLESWPHKHGELAEQLGLPASAFMAMGTRWATPHRAWAFPMTDGCCKTVGIRLRSPSGQKWSVTGSHTGVFLPMQMWGHGYRGVDYLWIVEGATDTAAAVSLGLTVIGRPSCSGGLEYIRMLVNRIRLFLWRIVIVADRDGPGLEGAEVLQRHLPVMSTILMLPAKDMREFVRSGGTVEILQEELRTAIWKGVER